MSYLFRALRPEEIHAGIIPIPKAQSMFEALPRLGIDSHLPFTLDATVEYAVRQHQWQQKDTYPTSGISTTPHLERAQFYAQCNGIIVKIDRRLCEAYGIKEYVVNEVLRAFPQDIAVPEDDEVIIVPTDPNVFPREVIVEVLKL